MSFEKRFPEFPRGRERRRSSLEKDRFRETPSEIARKLDAGRCRVRLSEGLDCNRVLLHSRTSSLRPYGFASGPDIGNIKVRRRRHDGAMATILSGGASMRMMLKAHFDVEAANLTINEGSAGAVFDKIFNICRPEAAYFGSDHGRRSLYAFLDVQSVDQIPMLTEPLFHAFAATVEVIPVMTPDDLAKGLKGYAESR